MGEGGVGVMMVTAAQGGKKRRKVWGHEHAESVGGKGKTKASIRSLWER